MNTQPNQVPDQIQWSPRGVHRLEIARGLMGLRADVDVLSAISGFPKATREELRGLVDWVEDYDLGGHG